MCNGYTRYYGLDLNRPGNGKFVFVWHRDKATELSTGCSEPMPKYIMVESRKICCEAKGRCSEAQVKYCRTCSVRLQRVGVDIHEFVIVVDWA